MSDNGSTKGTAVEGRPIVVEVECQSGVMAHVRPINIPTLKAIQMKAQFKFPYPDKAPYQKPDENSFNPEQLTPAEENPDYIAECKRIEHERALWVDRTIFDWCVTFPQFPDHEEMVKWFAPKLKLLREIAELPEDDYEATLFHLVLTWNQPALNEHEKLFAATSEYNRLVQLAIQTVSLTPAEVTAGIRFFRPKVQ